MGTNINPLGHTPSPTCTPFAMCTNYHRLSHAQRVESIELKPTNLWQPLALRDALPFLGGWLGVCTVVGCLAWVLVGFLPPMPHIVFGGTCVMEWHMGVGVLMQRTRWN